MRRITYWNVNACSMYSEYSFTASSKKEKKIWLWRPDDWSRYDDGTCALLLRRYVLRHTFNQACAARRAEFMRCRKRINEPICMFLIFSVHFCRDARQATTASIPTRRQFDWHCGRMSPPIVSDQINDRIDDHQNNDFKWMFTFAGISISD